MVNSGLKGLINPFILKPITVILNEIYVFLKINIWKYFIPDLQNMSSGLGLIFNLLKLWIFSLVV